MNTFFTILKKSIVATVFLIFGTMAVYVPHQANNIKPAEAVVATLPLQITQQLELIWMNITETLTEANTYLTQANTHISAAMETALKYKEYVLDGLAWSIAKGVVNTLLQSVVSWAANGFPDGGPMFVQDIQNFLINTATNTFLDFIGDDFEALICEPFRLDVKLSLALNFGASMESNSTSARGCNLDDIIDNVENFKDFLSGGKDSFSKGGWNDWFDVTNSPQVYTPYGASISAEISLNNRILKAANEEMSFLSFGSGFMSDKKCTGSGATQECFVSTPGKIIQDALSFNLDSGRQSLVQADEIDEIIGSLLSSVVNHVVNNGISVIMGDSSSNSSGSYSNFVNNLNSNNFGNINTPVATTPQTPQEEANSILYDSQLVEMMNTLSIQKNYNTVGNFYYSKPPFAIQPIGINSLTSIPSDHIGGTGSINTSLVMNEPYGTTMLYPYLTQNLFDENQISIFKAGCLTNNKVFIDDGTQSFHCLDVDNTLSQQVAIATPSYTCSDYGTNTFGHTINNSLSVCLYTPFSDTNSINKTFIEMTTGDRADMITVINKTNRDTLSITKLINGDGSNLGSQQSLTFKTANAAEKDRRIAIFNSNTYYLETSINSSKSVWSGTISNINNIEISNAEITTDKEKDIAREADIESEQMLFNSVYETERAL